MLEPQSTEGEDSVSSVSLELMTKDYASRIMHFKPEKIHQGSGAITQLWPTQSSQNGAPRPSWVPIIRPKPPLQLRRGQVLDGPGPSQWAQAM
ncbi:hypothetical protein O181_045626 [Austropuccinia psidii MF-1]|uniref:Uncharacterized protein n=1 Tax=Austropuccinia psidii MF-1 TaxID=1389203 RepID=A0A9Q3DSN2_9BASI|nr:hypothetical protein [Austropuccinia psidii MF-1]